MSKRPHSVPPHQRPPRPAPAPVDHGRETVWLDDSQDASEHERGEEFIRLFNEIDHFIKRAVASSGGEGFFRRLSWAVRENPTLKRHADDLMEFSELRNALVHDRHFPNRLIAVPTTGTLARFRRIVESIVAPRRVIPQFASELRVFDAAEPLTAALEYIHASGFTQIVARQAGQLRLATAAGVTRWLAGHIALGTLPAATVADVLALEKPEALALLPASTTVEEAVDMFQRSVAAGRSRLFAILITQHGKAEEDPLGIITPADLIEEDPGA